MLALSARAQNDSLRFKRLEERLQGLEAKVRLDSLQIEEYKRSTFYLYQYLMASNASTPSLKFGAYVDAYYAWYRDSTGTPFSKFPTVSPRSNQFALNMVYLSAQYVAAKVRGNLGIHFGDIPVSSWDPQLNMIQEANLGLRLHRRLWVDGGFFRTHIGMESIQPRENITQSLAVTTYFEPYFLSGIKLSWSLSDRFIVQVHGFNGFNNFIENNRNKAMGAAAIYTINPQTLLTFNTIYSDESPDTVAYAKHRLYNDVYFVHRGDRLEFGAEANFGLQQHSGLEDSTQTAFIFSGILALKYKFGKQANMAVYARGEVFEDSDEILTGPVENDHHELVGINLVGGTMGVEFKPVANSFMRLEGRYLHTQPRETIFYWDGRYYRYRLEGMMAMGVWF
jgi:hypothetical protein